MILCEYCGDSIDALTYDCNYCSQSFCRSHRLPETHDCPRVSDAHPPTSTRSEVGATIDRSRGGQSAEEVDFGNSDADLQELRERAEAEAEGQPYSVADVQHTVGTTPDSNFDSSPDVAIDGSIKEDDSKQEDATDTPNSASAASKQRIAGILLGLLVLVLLYIVFVS